MPFCFIIAFYSLLVPVKEYSFEEALKNGQIQAEIYYYSDTSSDYLDRKATMKIVLKSADVPLRITFKPGASFYSDDTAFQDQILMGRQIVRVMPGEEKEVALVTMCTQRYRSAPPIGATFHAGKARSTDMTGLAGFLESNNYPYHTAQAAIWCVSDGEPIENITGDDEAAVNDIRKYVARLRGEEAPLYRISEFSGVASNHSLTILFKIRLKKEGIGKLVLYNPAGQEYRQLMKEGPMPDGWYEVRFEIVSTNLQPGIYRVVLIMNGMNLQQENYRVL